MSTPTTHQSVSTPGLHRRQTHQREFIAVTALALLGAFLFLVTGLTPSTLSSQSAGPKREEPARLSDDVSVQARGRGNPAINLGDGHQLFTAYVGLRELRVALEQNRAEPLSLVSADFDEDGVPDLVSGYGYQQRGIVTLLRGNVDAIYPNAPEAQRRKVTGSFTDAPFLSPAGSFSLPIPAEFVGAGDFDADGHWDVVAASRARSYLVLLSGDGHGGFAPAKKIFLSGAVTAMTTREINRPDGLTDVVVGVTAEHGAQVLVFEGPDGALSSSPEVFDLPAPVAGLVLAKLNEDYLMDLGVAAGSELLIVEGRDRKLSLDKAGRAKIPEATITRKPLNFAVNSILAGNFSGGQDEELALLAQDGTLHLLSRPQVTGTEKEPGGATTWTSKLWATGSWSSDARLASARVSMSGADDMLITDPLKDQLQIVTPETAEAGATGKPRTSEMEQRGRVAATLDVSRGTLAVLPMRLNTDALSDLVILRGNQTALTIMASPQHPEATFTVTNTNDSGAGSLRDAINQANLNPGPDLISFNISGPKTITPLSPLPATTGPVTIDGTTQPGFTGTPIIELNGSSVANGEFALQITGGGSTVRGLVINLFDGSPGPAIQLKTSGGNVVEGNFLGTDVTGTLDLGNGRGVFIDGSSNNQIGGTAAAARNLISGNDIGIDTFAISSATTSGHLVQGNFIGTDLNGTAALGNGSNGVELFRVASSTVGGTVVGARNIISGNGNSGILVETTNGNLVQGNYIGTDKTGAVDLGNVQSGVSTTSGSNDTVGGTTPAARNVISGNGGQGILIRGDSNLVQGNYIGTNFQGTAAIGNLLNGVATSDAPNNTIGGATPAARNIISANGQNGVSIGLDLDSGSTGITVRNNYIGTDVNGINCLGNFRDGVVVNRGAVSHTISQNLITCNGRNGVNIPNAGAVDPGIRIEVTENDIFANALLGIDLGETGITPNDLGDPDGGANFQQNFPVLNSFGPIAPPADLPNKPIDPSIEAITVNATLNSTPDTTFIVHWYFSGDSQCTANQLPGKPLKAGKLPPVTTNSSGNVPFNFEFDFPPAITNGVIHCSATDLLGNTSEFSDCLPVTDGAPAPSSVQFISSTANVSETLNATTKVDLNVTRSGDVSTPATVNYATSDGTASERFDYQAALGTLRFAAGESSKTISVFIVDDRLGESGESFNVTLSNPIGVALGSTASVRVTINTNEVVNGLNPVKNSGFNTDFFVRQQYLDFFNREADPPGLAFWKNQIDECSDQACREIRRINVSAAFFVSGEFQETGYLVYLTYQAAFNSGEFLKLRDFLPDLQEIGRGVVITDPGGPALLEANKVRFFNDFVQRANFLEPGNYPTTMTAAAFVDKLNANTIDPRVPGSAGSLNSALRDDLVAQLAANPSSPTVRAQVLRQVAENSVFKTRQFNKAFVLMQYFGYLRRNPNDPPELGLDFAGYNFWLNKLYDFNGNYIAAEMVKAFITAGEYQGRFGP